MIKLFYSLLSKLLHRNVISTPTSVILDQMNEPRQLPVGLEEFYSWANRIIGGLPVLASADKDSQVFALASMIMTLGPQESHKPDIHFLKSLLKGASNQVAYSVIQEIKTRKQSESAVAPITVTETAEATLERAKSVPNIKLVN